MSGSRRPRGARGSRSSGSPPGGLLTLTSLRAARREELARRHYFTTRHPGVEPIYEYHPLFRQVLQSRAGRAFRPGQRAEMERAAAALLEANGQVEAAVELRQRAGDRAGLERLILAHAPALLEQGRRQTLEGWLQSLPPARLDQVPWLGYWLGAARRPVDLRGALQQFERAFERFRAEGDPTGTLLACSGVIEAISLDWGEFGRLDRWIAALEQLLRDVPAGVPVEIETRVATSLFGALVHCRPHHPDMAWWAERADALTRASPDTSLRASPARPSARGGLGSAGASSPRPRARRQHRCRSIPCHRESVSRFAGHPRRPTCRPSPSARNSVRTELRRLSLPSTDRRRR